MEAWLSANRCRFGIKPAHRQVSRIRSFRPGNFSSDIPINFSVAREARLIEDSFANGCVSGITAAIGTFFTHLTVNSSCNSSGGLPIKAISIAPSPGNVQQLQDRQVQSGLGFDQEKSGG